VSRKGLQNGFIRNFNPTTFTPSALLNKSLLRLTATQDVVDQIDRLVLRIPCLLNRKLYAFVEAVVWNEFAVKITAYTFDLVFYI